MGAAVPAGCAVSWDAIAAGCGRGARLYDDGYVGVARGLQKISRKVCGEYEKLDRECEEITVNEKNLIEPHS